MVIDSSAVLGILLEEPESSRLLIALRDDPVRIISVASVLEASITVETRRGETASLALDAFLARAGCEIVAADARQLEVARHAHRAFGKGRHPARLNFGDCFSYALAKVTGEPLLCKGDDFARTDIARVAY